MVTITANGFTLSKTKSWLGELAVVHLFSKEDFRLSFSNSSIRPKCYICHCEQSSKGSSILAVKEDFQARLPAAIRVAEE